MKRKRQRITRGRCCANCRHVGTTHLLHRRDGGTENWCGRGGTFPEDIRDVLPTDCCNLFAWSRRKEVTR